MTTPSGSTEYPLEGWGVDAVARRLGVAPSTVRSWQRRYGLGPTEHRPGQRRRYSPIDVARLQLMHAALTQGVAAADAARWALRHADPEHALQQYRRAPRPPDADGPPPGPPAADAADAPNRTTPRPRPGGRSLALPGHGAEARGLARAVLALDAGAVRAVLAEALDTGGVVHTWDMLARPVLSAIARRWARTGTGVEMEHLLSACLMRELDRAAAAARARHPPRNARPVVLACVADEQHSLPLDALAAALAERQVGAHLLGAALPPAALDDAVRRLAPAAVLLWAQSSPHPVCPHPVALPRQRNCRWFVGGPGWTTGPTPRGARVLETLTAARDALTDAALGAPVEER